MEDMLNDLCNLELDSGLINSLTKSLSDFSPTTNTTIINVMKNSVFGIGAGLLTLFMLMELIAMVNRSDSSEQGIMGIQLPANIMIKFAIFSVLFCRFPTILGAIEELAVSIANSLANTDYTFGVGLDASQVHTVIEAVDNLGIIQRIFTYIVILISWLLVHLIMGIVGITAIFRSFELWLLLLFAPIPLACLASKEFNQTAFNFLKNFTAVSLNAAAIVACFVIYKTLMSSFIVTYDPSIDVSAFINSMLINNIMYVFALAVTVFSCGRITKQMFGVI